VVFAEKEQKQDILNENGRGKGVRFPAETKNTRKFQKNKYGNIPKILVS
jgi:hypothetical protein